MLVIPERKRVLETNIALVTVLMIFFFITRSHIPIYIAIGLALTTLFLKSVAGYFTAIWLSITKFIGSVISRIMLSIIYVLILVPMAFIYKITRRRNPDHNKETYFSERNGIIKPEDMINTW